MIAIEQGPQRWSVLVAIIFTAMMAVVALPAQAEPDLWIDVRTAEEFDRGHVAQAVNIPFDVIADHIAAVSPDKQAEIYLYCRSGRRSGIALKTLQDLGYSKVTNVGGLTDAQALEQRLLAP
ncbi:hypothetical protein SIN8267_01293 [Sinobacterium norvegicum]|uniref:Rhodanese domain-containing protein n=1 Tax=Sinobacterium norvegicum TaxID=1641715 RepID=A0ABM9ADB1_9GAMM|nr:rhodanese-like domain-containing protein [Sinobacterium norvegicum]CAH0991191.1 hypothetical protein SIN8267_01293 [Sinobacterium norvegicum]